MEYSIIYFEDLLIQWFKPRFTTECGVLYVPGLPGSIPDEKDIKQFQNRLKSHIFIILYAGHPKNPNGKLMAKNPSQTIERLIIALREGVIATRLSSIYILGNSFGASLALQTKGADKIVAVSPVVDFVNLYSASDQENSETLLQYLLSNGYRIDRTGWDQLWSGKTYRKESVNVSGEVYVVFSINDHSIHPKALRRVVRSFGFKNIILRDRKHISWKHIDSQTRKKIFGWVNSRDVLLIKNDKMRSAIFNKKDFYFKQARLTMVTGSVAAYTAVPESDVDLIEVSPKDFTKKRRLPRTIIETYSLGDINSLARLVKENIRWASKLHHAEVISLQPGYLKKIIKIKKEIQENKALILLYNLLERLRCEARYNRQKRFLPARIKKGAGGRRSLGFLVYSDALIHGHTVNNFWSSLQIMIAENRVPPEVIGVARKFFSTLWEPRYSTGQVARMMSIQSRIIDRYTKHYILPWLETEFNLQGLKICNGILTARYNPHSLPAMLMEAVSLKNIDRLNLIFTKTATIENPMARFCLLYFLATNSAISEELAMQILHVAKKKNMSNIRRNLVQNEALWHSPMLRTQLLEDPDPKVRHYANIFFLRKMKVDDMLLRFKENHKA